MSDKKQHIISQASSGSEMLFEEFVSSVYLPFIRENKRSWSTDARHLKRHILPVLGPRPLSEITAETLRAWLLTLKHAGLSESSRYHIFWIVKYVLNCAVRWGVLADDDAFREVVVAKSAPARRPDALSPAQFRTLMRLLAQYRDRPGAQAIHLLLLTGAAPSEILCARWENVHLRQAVLVTTISRTGCAHLIPLSGEAICLLRHLPRRRDVPWLFASSSGRRLTSVFYTWNLLRRRLGRPDLRLRDLHSRVLPDSGEHDAQRTLLPDLFVAEAMPATATPRPETGSWA